MGWDPSARRNGILPDRGYLAEIARFAVSFAARLEASQAAERHFKDAVKVLKHSGVILDDNRARFRFTRSWLNKVNLQFTFNHATPECTQDDKFCAWMAKLNQAISRDDPDYVPVDPNPEGIADVSKTETEE